MSTVFFDFDGTLVDASRRDYEMYVKVLDGTHTLSREGFLLHRSNGVSSMNLLRCSSVDRNYVELDYLMHTYYKLLECDDALRMDVMFDDTSNVLSMLHGTHELIIVSARANERALIDECDRMGISYAFNAIRTTSDARTKAHEMRKFPLSNGSYMVGDSEYDILAAQQIGAQSIAMTTGVRNEKFLRTYSPTMVFNRLNEIVDYIQGERI